MAKILFIGSHDLHYWRMKSNLQLYKHKIEIANQNSDFLALATIESPDLILLDIDVPRMDSWKILKTLKQSQATLQIPIMALTNKRMAGQLLIQAGFDGYTRKPIVIKNLLLGMNALMEPSSTTQIGPDDIMPDLSASTISSASDRTKFPRKPSTRTTVIYIEDNETDSQAMAEIIQRVGYSYANISSSLQALPRTIELKPQLIFLDLVMPVVNGYELCSQIRRISTLRKVPIIIVTNNDGLGDRVRSNIVGASGFLAKPITAHGVLKVLVKHLLTR